MTCDEGKPSFPRKSKVFCRSVVAAEPLEKTYVHFVLFGHRSSPLGRARQYTPLASHLQNTTLPHTVSTGCSNIFYTVLTKPATNEYILYIAKK